MNKTLTSSKTVLGGSFKRHVMDSYGRLRGLRPDNKIFESSFIVYYST